MLERVVMESSRVGLTAGFFIEVLGADVAAHDTDFAELVWPGGRIRLEAGPRPGIRRLEMSGTEPMDRIVAGTRIVGVATTGGAHLSSEP